MVRGHQEWTDLMKETRFDSSIVEGLTKHGREPNKSLFRLVGLGCRKINGPDIVRHGFCRTLRLITSKIFPYRPKYSREPMVF
jgi:hypothetical protein